MAAFSMSMRYSLYSDRDDPQIIPVGVYYAVFPHGIALINWDCLSLIGKPFPFHLIFSATAAYCPETRSYLSWLKDTGKLEAAFQDSMLLKVHGKPIAFEYFPQNAFKANRLLTDGQNPLPNAVYLIPVIADKLFHIPGGFCVGGNEHSRLHLFHTEGE